MQAPLGSIQGASSPAHRINTPRLRPNAYLSLNRSAQSPNNPLVNPIPLAYTSPSS